ncbi:hypothetical protein LQR30_15515 [Chromobacterium piscinae]|uniref:hypothetical protein n=1 Tax=Chromobacterium piscinae TaxID=686831 RepID=UPI001E60D947|nr:hypothetical protein [Chromobacterium piscinae]MCD4505506.1 hypothetical protein [Chromobacterium piscinae]
MLSGRVYALGGLLLAALWAGTVWRAYGHGREVERLHATATVASADAERARGDLDAYRAEVGRLYQASVDFEARLDQLRDAKPKVIERYNRVIEQVPLPADCRPGPDRLRELNSAIEAANAAIAGQYGEALQTIRAGNGG